MDSLNNDGEVNFDFILDKVSQKISAEFITNKQILIGEPIQNVNEVTNNISEEKKEKDIDEDEIIIHDEETTNILQEKEKSINPENIEATKEITDLEQKNEDNVPEISDDRTNNTSDKVKEDSVAISKEEIRTTPLTIDEVKENWTKLANKIISELPSIGKMWEYTTPISLTDYSMTVKFDPEHNTYKDLCMQKAKEISAIFKSFFHTEVFKIKFILETTEDDERIIEVKPTKVLTAEEKKINLLEKAPQLEFLFKAPLNGKIVK